MAIFAQKVLDRIYGFDLLTLGCIRRKFAREPPSNTLIKKSNNSEVRVWVVPHKCHDNKQGKPPT